MSVKPKKPVREKGNKSTSRLLGEETVDPDFGFTSPTDRQHVPVHVQVVFLNLGDIDTAGEFFQAVVFVQCRWTDPSLDDFEQAGEMCELENWQDYWNPGVFVENVLGAVEQKVWHVVSYNAQGQATVYERRRVMGKFYEHMELNDYPFDAQDLTITVTSNRAADDVDLVHDKELRSCLLSEDRFKDAQEWTLYNRISVRIYNPLPPQGGKQSKRKDSSGAVQYKMTNVGKFRFPRPTLSVSCKAERKWWYFVWNIFFIMTVIGGLVFTTFSVPADLTANRLQMSFVLLLSNITFKLAASKNTPQVSYLTSMDFYIVISFILMSAVCLWHAIVGHVTESVRHVADCIALGALLSCWFLFNMSFLAVKVYKMKKRKSELSTTGNKYIVTYLTDDILQLESTTGSHNV